MRRRAFLLGAAVAPAAAILPAAKPVYASGGMVTLGRPILFGDGAPEFFLPRLSSPNELRLAEFMNALRRQHPGAEFQDVFIDSVRVDVPPEMGTERAPGGGDATCRSPVGPDGADQ